MYSMCTSSFFFLFWMSKLNWNIKDDVMAIYLMKIKSINCRYDTQCSIFKSIGDFLFQLSKFQQKQCITFKRVENDNRMSIHEIGYIFCYIQTLSCSMQATIDILIKRRCLRTFNFIIKYKKKNCKILSTNWNPVIFVSVSLFPTYFRVVGY